MHSSSFRHERSARPVTPKTTNPHEMSLDELRAACEANETAYYRERAEADPNNSQAQDDYRQHCLLKGLDPNTGKVSRFASMSKEEIGNEWEIAGKKQVADELEAYRDHQAQVFLVSQPRYQPTPANSDAIVAELNRQGLRGSADDINCVFEKLVAEGKVVPKEIIEPVQFFNREEAYSLSVDELRKRIETGR